MLEIGTQEITSTTYEENKENKGLNQIFDN